MDDAVRMLVTGGSGFIGTEAIRQALRKGWIVKNFDIREPKEPSHREIWTKIDITERDCFIAGIEAFNPTHILHLAAMTGMDIVDMADLEANTKGVEYLVEGSSRLKTLKRVLFTSSLLVCKNGYIPKDDHDYCPINLYGKSKVIGEQIVRAANASFEWVIARPTSIWGPWFEHSYKTFFMMIGKGLYFHPGRDDQPKPKSYVGNTVHMMYTLLFADVSLVCQKVFYLSDWPVGTTREWAEEINSQMGGRRIATVPLPLLRRIARVGDFIKKAGKEPPLTTFRLNNMLTGGVYPTQNTQSVVGELPYTLADGCRETIDWMRRQNLLKRL